LTRTTSTRTPAKAKLKKIKLLMFDFDGVFTDNFVYLSEEGTELKRFFVPDGVGIWLLHANDLHVAIVSGNNTRTTTARARRLRIKHVYQDVRDKTKPFQQLKKKLRLAEDECLFMGDDLTDWEVMQLVGVAVAPSDAHARVKKVANWITRRPGGHGAIREVVEAVLSAKGQLMAAYEQKTV